ncbi:MAG: BspA family leucine-rich repeat surface protein, partial [Bacteroidales bacterium]|nr:BspA family leucine-rich repeat surface protein [Bacteroidales bacterium]
LTSLDVTNFKTGNVTSMSLMFSYCSGLTSLDVTNFETGNVTDMHAMFAGCSGLTSLDVSNFKTQHVKDMRHMFYKCSGLTSLDVTKFETQKVTSMFYMFYGCSGLTSLDVSNFETGNVTDMSYMFDNCSRLTSLDVSNFKTQHVMDMRFMFNGCSGLTSLDVTKFNTKNVMYMFCMFRDCSKLTSLDVSKFDTKNVTTMWSMFSGCSGLTSLDVSNFNTQNVKDMSEMFNSCSGLTSLDVTKFDTENVTDMNSMFYGCSGLTVLDLRSFDTDKVVGNSSSSSESGMREMFYGCPKLTTILVSDKWKTDNVVQSSSMFYTDPELIGDKGTTFKKHGIQDKTYAHIDDAPERPGYLTTGKYKIFYDLDADDDETDKLETYTGAITEFYDEEVTLVKPTREGYTFLGWTGTLITRLTEPTKNVKIAKGDVGNRIYTAHWEINQYTVTLPPHFEFITANTDGKFDFNTNVEFKVSDGYVVTSDAVTTNIEGIDVVYDNGIYSVTVPASDVEIIAETKKHVELSVIMNDFDCRDYVAPVVKKGDVDVTEQCNLRIINSEEQDVTEIIGTAIPGHYYLMVHYENDDEIGGGGAEFDIQKATPNPQVQAASNLVYDGNNQTLLMPATSDEFYAVLYSLSGDDDSYTANIEKIFGNDAKEYTIYYKVEGDDCYDEFAQTSLVAIINPKTITATHPDDYEIIKEYDGNTDITEDFNGIVTLSGVEAVDDGKVTIVCTSSYPSKDVVDYYEDDDLGTKSEELTFALSGERASNYVLAEASQTATYQLQIQPKMLSCWNAESVLSQAYELTKNYDGTSSVVIKDDYKTIQLSHGNCSDVLDGESVDITISGDYYDGFDYVSAPGNDYLLSLFASLPQKGNYGVYSDFGYYAASMFDYPSGGVIKAKVDFDNKGHGTAPATQYVAVGGKVSEPQPLSATGYKFAGWYSDDETFAEKWDMDDNDVTGNLVLYAKWQKILGPEDIEPLIPMTKTFDCDAFVNVDGRKLDGTSDGSYIEYTDPDTHETVNIYVSAYYVDVNGEATSHDVDVQGVAVSVVGGDSRYYIEDFTILSSETTHDISIEPYVIGIDDFHPSFDAITEAGNVFVTTKKYDGTSKMDFSNTMSDFPNFLCTIDNMPAYCEEREYNNVFSTIKSANFINAEGVVVSDAGSNYGAELVLQIGDYDEEEDRYITDFVFSGNQTQTSVQFDGSIINGEITKAALTVTAEANSKVFGDDDPVLTYTVSGLQGSDTETGVLNGELKRAEGEDVGDYAINQGTLHANDNYTIAYTGATFTINPFVITATDPKLSITLTPSEYTYDGTAKEPTVSVTYDGKTIPASEYTVTYSDNTNVGTATATINDNDGGNYTVNGSETFTITPFIITATDPKLAITLTPNSFIYDGTAKEPTVKVEYDGVEIPSNEYTVSYENNVNVGTEAKAIISDNDGGNYTINGSEYFEITPFIITPTDPKLAITLTPSTFIYDGTAKEPTVKVEYDGVEIPSSEYTVSYEN